LTERISSPKRTEGKLEDSVLVLEAGVLDCTLAYPVIL
jgi:hypothetical protein